MVVNLKHDEIIKIGTEVAAKRLSQKNLQFIWQEPQSFEFFDLVHAIIYSPSKFQYNSNVMVTV